MINVGIFGTDLSIDKTYLIIGLIISFCIYMFIFSKRNPDAGVGQYINAAINFCVLCVAAMFLIVGYFIAIAVIKSKQYAGLIIPIGWLFICYFNIKKIIIHDFQITIGNLINFNWNKWGPIVILSVLSIGFWFATFMIFLVVPDRENQPYGPFPLIIAGIIFLLATIVIYVLLYKTITGKIKYTRTGHSSFSQLSNQELLTSDAAEYEIKSAAKEDNRSVKVFFIVWCVFACLFAAIFIYCYLVDKGVIRP